MNDKTNIELQQWLQAESPLTRFARSLRMEVVTSTPSDATQTKAGEGESDSILAGIDLDVLPQDARDALIAKDAEFKTKLISANEAKTKLEAANLSLQTKVSEHQSRADRAVNKLSQHNIPLDGQIQQSQTNSHDALIDELTKEFMAEGIEEKVARVHAKLHAKTISVTEKRTDTKLAKAYSPVVNAISDMRADTVFESVVDEDTTGHFGDEEIYNSVKKSVQTIVESGGVVDKDIVKSLLHMELGSRLASGKTVTPKQQQQQQQREPRTFQGSRLRGENFVTTRGAFGNGNNPAPVNTDTADAVNITVAQMLRGTNIKPKA